MFETIRTVDELGRIVLPKSYRDLLGLNPGEPLELTLLGEGIWIQKIQPKQK